MVAKKLRNIKRKRHQKSVARKSVKKVRRKTSPNRNKVKHVVVDSSLCSNNIIQVLEYKNLFKDCPEPPIESLLSCISREYVIKLVCVLENLYTQATIDKLDIFFSSKSTQNRNLVNKLISNYVQKIDSNTKIVWVTSETPIRLLREVFAMNYINKNNTTLSEEEMELNIFKAILLINQKTVDFKIRKTDNNLLNQTFLLSCINTNMMFEDEKERSDRTIMQLYFAKEFFNFLCSNQKYRPLYDAFLKKYNIDNWQEYVRTIYGIVMCSKYNSGFIDAELKYDTQNLINKCILESLCISCDDVIRYNSASPFDRNGNTDYKVFRECPIITMPNGDYCIFNWNFLVDKLFNSLYFDFNSMLIPKSLLKKVQSIITEEFSEKYLFDGLIGRSISNSLYTSISEKNLKSYYKPNQDELGPPDYLLIKDDICIIFECKDIRIGGAEIESHDFETILDIYSNKLNYKRWKYDSLGKRVDLTEGGKTKGKRIGVSQLTYHILNIKSNTFPYYTIKSNSIIYPVLVISDYKYIHHGLNHIANEWYKNDMGDKYDVSIERPLIVMSFLTLIKYNTLFKEKGFEYYFEEYYSMMGTPVTNIDDAMQKYISFDMYMSKYPYDLKELRDDVLNIIKFDM